MKIISTAEREFITKCIKAGKRADGRTFSVGRILDVCFGETWGSCIISLGNTRVLCQVSAEITEPKSTSPTEGSLHINLELSVSTGDVAMPRNSDVYVETQRCLERCIRDSKCVDLESLCIVAGSKAWTIRVDIHVLNDDGNFLECASIAAISSLAHFKRPNVTVSGREVTEYSLEDREPVPLTLHHMPVIVNLALFDQGKHIVVDPTYLEERICDGCYIIGINAHQEICFIHRTGILLLREDAVEKCEDISVRRAQNITQAIRSALEDDSYKRVTKAPVGFIHMLETASILGAKHRVHQFDLKSITMQQEFESDEAEIVEDVALEDQVRRPRRDPDADARIAAVKERTLRILKDSETSLFQGGASKWDIESEDETSEEESLAETSTPAVKQELESNSNARNWYSKSPFS